MRSRSALRCATNCCCAASASDGGAVLGGTAAVVVRERALVAVRMVVDFADRTLVVASESIAIGIIQSGKEPAHTVRRDAPGDVGAGAEMTTTGLAVHVAHAALTQRIAASVVNLLLGIFGSRRVNAAATLPRHRWLLPRTFAQLLDHPHIVQRQMRHRLNPHVLLHPRQLGIEIMVD